MRNEVLPSTSGKSLGDINQGWTLYIGKMVEIDLATGSVTFLDGYEPDAAAKLFWDAVRRGF